MGSVFKLGVVIIITFFLLMHFMEKEDLISEQNNSPFVTSVKYLTLPPSWHIDNIVLYNNAFYTSMYSESQNNNSFGQLRTYRVFIFDHNGIFIKEVNIPASTRKTNRFDITVSRDNKLWLSTYTNGFKSFIYNDTSDSFVLSNKANSTEDKSRLLYEDSLFEVSNIDRGEWGGTVFFKDKRTNISYEAGADGVKSVVKLKNAYYVTNYLAHMSGWGSIIRIDDPLKLTITDTNRFYFLKGSSSYKGTTIVYDNDDIRLVTSFVLDNQLLTIFEEYPEFGAIGRKCVIGSLINNTIKQSNTRLIEFDSGLSLGLQQIKPDGSQLLRCNFRSKSREGFMLIKGKNITFYITK